MMLLDNRVPLLTKWYWYVVIYSITMVSRTMHVINHIWHRITIACLACLYVVAESNTSSYRLNGRLNYLRCSTPIGTVIRRSCRRNRMSTAWWAKNRLWIALWILMRIILEVSKLFFFCRHVWERIQLTRHHIMSPSCYAIRHSIDTFYLLGWVSNHDMARFLDREARALDSKCHHQIFYTTRFSMLFKV